MSKKVKVASITIQYPDGKTKELSLDDARALLVTKSGNFCANWTAGFEKSDLTTR